MNESGSPSQLLRQQTDWLTSEPLCVKSGEKQAAFLPVVGLFIWNDWRWSCNILEMFVLFILLVYKSHVTEAACSWPVDCRYSRVWVWCWSPSGRLRLMRRSREHLVCDAPHTSGEGWFNILDWMFGATAASAAPRWKRVRLVCDVLQVSVVESTLSQVLYWSTHY